MTPKVTLEPIRVTMDRLDGTKADIEALQYGQRVMIAAEPERRLAEAVNMAAVAARSLERPVWTLLVLGLDDDGRPALALVDAMPIWGAFAFDMVAKRPDTHSDIDKAASMMALAAVERVEPDQVDVFRAWLDKAASLTVGEAVEAAPAWLQPYLQFAAHLAFTAELVGDPASILYTLGKRPQIGFRALEKIDELLGQIAKTPSKNLRA